MNIPLPTSPPISPFCLKQKENLNPSEVQNIKSPRQKIKFDSDEVTYPKFKDKCESNMSAVICNPGKYDKKAYPKVQGTDNITTKVNGRTKVNQNTMVVDVNPKINCKKPTITSKRSTPLSPTPLNSISVVVGKNDNTKI